MILVSACLACFNCRYDATNKEDAIIIKLIKEGKAIPVCPEQLSGLPTPRQPVEIKNGKVITKDGKDLTKIFQKGAQETIKICQKYNCTHAILKTKSPTCGLKKIYDGNFNGTLTNGNGITAQLLVENNIKIITSEKLDKITN